MGSSQSKDSKTNGRNDSHGTASPTQEKHNSADSTTPLTGRDRPNSGARCRSPSHHPSIAHYPPQLNRDDEILPNGIKIDEQEGHANVTRPPPPLRLRRWSELIDPHELTIDSHVRSPSGNLLAVEQFLVHPDRPRSIRERQEQIQARVRAASRLGQDVDTAGDEKPLPPIPSHQNAGGKRKGLLCGCFGSRS